MIEDLLFANNTVDRHLDDFERILSNIAYVSESKRPCKLGTDKINLLTDRLDFCGRTLEKETIRISSHKLKDYLENEPNTYGQSASVIYLENTYQWLLPSV